MLQKISNKQYKLYSTIVKLYSTVQIDTVQQIVQYSKLYSTIHSTNCTVQYIVQIVQYNTSQIVQYNKQYKSNFLPQIPNVVRFPTQSNSIATDHVDKVGGTINC